MLYTTLKALHVLAIVVWVGGMVFAHFFLRPEAAALEPPQRLKLMHGVLGRFFGAVTVAIAVALASGLWMMGLDARPLSAMPHDWLFMAAVGLAMMAIFGHIRMARFTALRRAVQAGDWPAGGAAMNGIRRWVTVNLVLGVAVVAVAVAL